MITRVHDASRLNEIANHPAVLPCVTLPGQGVIDLGPIVSDARNIVLGCEGGGFVCVWMEPGIYEVHSLFLPTARPRAITAAREAIAGMFLQGEAMELLTKVPVGNARADALARRCGFRHEFDRPDAWIWRGERVAVRHYALRYPDFVAAFADDLETHGRWFHERIEAIEADHGLPLHADDPAHDRHAGAAAAMILAGQVGKGITLYNRWARFAGYAAISLVSANPVVVDIGNGLRLTLTQDGFEAAPCP